MRRGAAHLGKVQRVGGGQHWDELGLLALVVQDSHLGAQCVMGFGYKYILYM